MESQRLCLDPSPKLVLDDVDIMYKSHPRRENVENHDVSEFIEFVESVLNSPFERHKSEGVGINDIV